MAYGSRTEKINDASSWMFSGFPNDVAHFKPVQKRPRFNKLLCTNLLSLAILYLLVTSSFAAAT